MTMGELARNFSMASGIWARTLTVIQDDGLAPVRLVRRDRPALGESFAEYPQPDAGDCVPWHWPARRHQHQRERPDRGAVRTLRRSVDPGDEAFARYLNKRKIPGASFMPIFYVPGGEEHYPYRGERCEGVEVIVKDRNALDAPELGIEAVSAIWKLYPEKFQIDRVDRLSAE